MELVQSRFDDAQSRLEAADEKNFSFHHLTDVQFMNIFSNTNKIFDLVILNF